MTPEEEARLRAQLAAQTIDPAEEERLTALLLSIRLRQAATRIAAEAEQTPTTTDEEDEHMREIKRGAQITGAERARLQREAVAAYRNGASIRELAEQYGRSYGWVHRLISSAEGVELRPRGGARSGPRRHPGEGLA